VCGVCLGNVCVCVSVCVRWCCVGFLCICACVWEFV